MSMMQHKETVRTYIEEVFNRGNVAAVEQFVSPSFVDHNPFSRQQAPGPAGQRQAVQMLREAFGDFHVALEKIVSEGDTVAIRGTVSGVHRGYFMGVPPTGKRVSWQAMTFLRMANGRIVERWSTHDLLGLLKEVGIIPERLEVPAVR